MINLSNEQIRVINENPQVINAASQLGHAIPMGQEWIHHDDMLQDAKNAPAISWILDEDTLFFSQSLARVGINPSQFASVFNELYEKAGRPRLAGDMTKGDKKSASEWATLLGEASRITATAGYIQAIDAGESFKEIEKRSEKSLAYRNPDFPHDQLVQIPLINRIGLDKNTMRAALDFEDRFPPSMVKIAHELDDFIKVRKPDSPIDDKKYLEIKLRLERENILFHMKKLAIYPKVEFQFIANDRSLTTNNYAVVGCAMDLAREKKLRTVVVHITPDNFNNKVAYRTLCEKGLDPEYVRRMKDKYGEVDWVNEMVDDDESPDFRNTLLVICADDNVNPKESGYSVFSNIIRDIAQPRNQLRTITYSPVNDRINSELVVYSHRLN